MQEGSARVWEFELKMGISCGKAEQGHYIGYGIGNWRLWNEEIAGPPDQPVRVRHCGPQYCGATWS
jgi:hypothetical protein